MLRHAYAADVPVDDLIEQSRLALDIAAEGETGEDSQDQRPEPLPDEFDSRFAATVAQSPQQYGRVLQFALDATTEGTQYAR